MITIAVAGESGTGKTYALRNIDPKEMVIVSPFKGIADLPFAGAMKNFKPLNPKTKEGNFILTNEILDLPDIMRHVNDERPEIKYLVIDDITHFQTARITSEGFRQRKNGGEAFARYDDLAAHIKQGLLPEDRQNFRDDLTLIHQYHIDEKDDGEQKFHTVGKMLEQKIKLPSYYTYVMYTYVKPMKDDDGDQGDRYVYTVKHDGTRPAKTPEPVFQGTYVPNDMKVAEESIRKFAYGS